MKPVLKQKLKEIEKTKVPTNKENFQYIRNIMNDLFEKVNNSQKDEDKFFDMYRFINERAKNGDLAAQDYLSYLYKKGMGDIIPANYETSMDWSFLAGSNGNEFAIEKLKIFFTRSYDIIFNIDNINTILKNHNIYKENYEYELGKLFCDAMVDTLQISLDELLVRKPTYSPSSVVKAQKYENARASSLEAVINYLKRP